ncbi:hypothetical protein YPPY36_3826, partial [Yersinia pestis PY-36]
MWLSIIKGKKGCARL